METSCDLVLLAMRATIGATMDRRQILLSLAAFAATGLKAEEEASRPRHKISAGELYNGMSQRFPVRVVLGGMVELQVRAPRLLLLPSRQRLGAALEVQLAGVPMARVPAGELNVAFALRYERRDQTLRANRMEILSLSWPGMPPELLQIVQATLPAVSREAVGEFLLYQFTARELSLADTMGFEPEEFRVVDDGLTVFFGPKQAR